MTKLIKTVIIAGSLLASTAVVSFADDAKTADKAPAGSGSASASKAKAAPAKGTSKAAPAKGSASK